MEVIRIYLPYILIALATPLYLIAIWRRWQKTHELIIGVVLLPFLNGFLHLGFGVIMGFMLAEKERVNGQKGAIGGPVFWVAVAAFAYTMVGILFTLGSMFFWGCVWYVWRMGFPESFWKMVYFGHKDRADILKDYDEQIKPEPPTVEQPHTELPPKE